MNVKKSILLLFALGIAINLNGFEAKQSIAGKTGYPYFDEAGELSLLLCDPKGQVRTIKYLDKILDDSVYQASKESEAIYSPVIKKDRFNRVWVLWESGQQNHGRIRIGRIKDEKITNIRILSKNHDGINFSPSMDITQEGQVWATWINYSEGKNSLIVKNVQSGKSWIIKTSRSFSLFTPKLIIDGEGKTWVFWVGQENGLDEIFTSYYDGLDWLEPSSISSDLSVPHFHPSVSRDMGGNPWVTYSAYDGNDYEIFVTSWDGTRWIPREKVTNNENLSDVQPSLCFYLDSTPVISWTQTGKGRRDIYIAFKDRMGWGPAVNISHSEGREESPVLISEGNKLAILWTDQKNIFLLPLSLFQLQNKPVSGEREDKTFLQSSHLSKSKFIGLGDSITFGSMNGPYQGNGYLPRLQELLIEIYENPVMSNRGVPGEPTWEALSRVTNVITTDLALYFLLMEGTNDVSTLSYSMNTTAFNLSWIISECIEFGVFPLISTIIPRKRNRWHGAAIVRTFELNEKIEQIALDYNIPLVNNFDAFFYYPEDQGGYKVLISSDNLHPSNPGYQVMAETWYEKIKDIPFPPVEIKASIKKREGVNVISWEDDPKVTTATNLRWYRIYRKRNNQSNYSPIALVDSSISTYRDENVTTDQEYSYTLSAINTDNIEGPLSDPSVSIIGEPYPPVNISIETVINKAYFFQEHINIVSWGANNQNNGLFTVTTYRIYRKQTGEEDTQFVLMGEVDSSQFEYIERGFATADEAESFVYGISAVDSDNNEGLIGKE